MSSARSSILSGLGQNSSADHLDKDFILQNSTEAFHNVIDV
jgi:hypothetical protein